MFFFFNRRRKLLKKIEIYIIDLNSQIHQFRNIIVLSEQVNDSGSISKKFKLHFETLVKYGLVVIFQIS